MAKCSKCHCKKNSNGNCTQSNDTASVLGTAYVIMFVFLAIVVGILLLFVGCESNEEVPPYEERIETYEVVTVYKYVRNITNNYGGIKRTEICYSFSYLDGDTLKHKENFRTALNEVTMGDKDLYIVDPYTGEECLQLTRETLKLLTGTSD